MVIGQSFFFCISILQKIKMFDFFVISYFLTCFYYSDTSFDQLSIFVELENRVGSSRIHVVDLPPRR